LRNIPGLLEARREGNQLRLTLANFGSDAERAVAMLGASSTSEAALTLEDAVIAYLGDRTKHISLLQEKLEAGVLP
jgi:hypothetical protein